LYQKGKVCFFVGDETTIPQKTLSEDANTELTRLYNDVVEKTRKIAGTDNDPIILQKFSEAGQKWFLCVSKYKTK